MKLILINVAFAVFSIGAELLSYFAIFDWRSVLPEQYAPYVILWVNVLNIVVRVLQSNRITQHDGRVTT